MHAKFLMIGTLCSLGVFAQTDTTKVIDTAVVDVTSDMTNGEKVQSEAEPVKVFYAQKLINANTVEVLNKGILEFRVIHNFGDIAGNDGGIRKFFGLDEAKDIKIGFQLGVGNRLNLIAARTRGGSAVQQLWELGLKYQFLRQMANDPKHPLSLTLYTNLVASSQKRSPDANKENSYADFSDRLSQLVQLMIARRFGNVSLQVSPTYVHTNYVVPGDQNSLFALGGAIRLPITKKFFLIADYLHAFRSEESKNTLRNEGINLFDVFGVGVEILTEGHIFQLNFTNAANILENRYIPRTTTSWGKGQYRWGFTISRRFVLFTEKK